MSLIIGILIPCLSKVRAQGQRVLCQAQFRDLGVVHTLYVGDYDGKLVPAIQGSGEYPYWYNNLGPYFSHERIDTLEELVSGAGRQNLRCPLDKSAYPSLLNPHGGNPHGWLSYAINSQLTTNMQTRTQSYAGMGGNRLDRVTYPAEAMLHSDVAYRSWVVDALSLMKQRYSAELGAHYDKLPSYPEQNQAIEQAYRHGGKMNLLWGDGHVSLMEGPLPSALKNPRFWGPLYLKLFTNP